MTTSVRVLGAVMLSGCSFAAVKALPRQPCTSTSSMPNADAIVATIAFMATVFAPVVGFSTRSSADDAILDVRIMGATTALLFGTSAVYGRAKVRACRRSDVLRLDSDETTRTQLARDLALELVTTARAAARAGDCDVVFEIDAHLMALDREIRTSAFLTDPLTLQCLNGVHGPTPPHPEPAVTP